MPAGFQRDQSGGFSLIGGEGINLKVERTRRAVEEKFGLAEQAHGKKGGLREIQ
jgi:hypothetical protein